MLREGVVVAEGRPNALKQIDQWRKRVLREGERKGGKCVRGRLGSEDEEEGGCG